MTSENGTILFIANPVSGASARKRVAQRFQAYLVEHRRTVRHELTHAAGHACDLARRGAADPDCTLVVCAGGDGTVREVAEGLQGSDTPLLIVPAGTENLLAGELGYDERLATVIAAYEEGTVRPLDLGRVDGRCFTCVVGVGFDGEVVGRLHGRRNGHIDYLDYLDPLWQTAWTHRFPTLRVAVDGHSVFEGRGMVCVGNISRYGGGLKILDRADYGDGLLDVCVYRCGGRVHLVKHALWTLAKQHTRARDVTYTQGRSIVIATDPTDTPVQIDGDPGVSGPLRITVIPQALHVITHPGARPPGIRTRLLRAIG